MSEMALNASDLSKSFRVRKSWFQKPKLVEAVKHINLKIDYGESVVFLGPNGAGKTTIIKLLCGILRPTIGSSTIAGFASGSMEANQRLGLVFGTRSNLWMFLTVKQSLKILGDIYGLSEKQSSKRAHLLSEIFEISDLLDSPPNILSLGQRMRCEIVASLIHSPSILLADEPTIGLDIVGKGSFRAHLQQWQEEEKGTLLLTSHDISDVEALCNRAILINEGVVGYDGSVQGLKGSLALKRNIKLTFSKPVVREQKQRNNILLLQDESLVKIFQIDTEVMSTVLAVEHLMEDFRDLVLDIAVEEVALEAIISKWYARGKKEDA